MLALRSHYPSFLLLLTSFLVSSISHVVGAAPPDYVITDLLERQLQQGLFLDLDEYLQFNYLGININAELAKSACPSPWEDVLSCIASDCPGFTKSCPSVYPEFINIPAANQGNAKAPATVVAPRQGAGAPDCPALNKFFCDILFSGENMEGCCLVDCTGQLHDLMTCVFHHITGNDRSSCVTPNCPVGTLGIPAVGAGDQPAIVGDITDSSSGVTEYDGTISIPRDQYEELVGNVELLSSVVEDIETRTTIHERNDPPVPDEGDPNTVTIAKEEYDLLTSDVALLSEVARAIKTGLPK